MQWIAPPENDAGNAALEKNILTRPAPQLSPEERDEVKKVAKELLTRLEELLVLNWRKKSAARSQLLLAIEDALDSGLPRAYVPELSRQKCSAVFEHVYESYPERNAGAMRRRVDPATCNEWPDRRATAGGRGVPSRLQSWLFLYE